MTVSTCWSLRISGMGVAGVTVLILLTTLTSYTLAAYGSKRVLLVSFDGFRYDLLNSTFTPFIYEWASNGTWFSNGVQSQYVTYTAPNHMSIVTGMREESHGIVSNYFYDPVSKEHFDLFNMTKKPGVVNSSLVEHWFGGEPIWLANQKAGGQSVVYYWPAGDAVWPQEPKRPTWHAPWRDYGNLSKWMIDVDDLVDRLEMDPKNNFAAWYVAEPDHTLHTYGFFFEERLKKTVSELDKVFHYLIDRLKDRGLLDSTDIILTADHGHAEIRGAKNVMCIPDFVKGEQGKDFEIGDHMIYPNDEKHANEIFINLTTAVKKYGYKVNIYYKKDLPPRFHYQKTPRVGEIVFEPEIGWATSFDCTKSEMEKQHGMDLSKDFHSSTHGMDPINSEMRALLVLKGPNFKRQIKVDEVPENIDLYPLMVKLLNATASSNEATLNIIGKSLRDDSFVPYDGSIPPFVVSPGVESLSIIFFILPAVCIVGLFFAYAWKRTFVNEDPTWAMATDNRYKPLSTTIDEAFDYSSPMRGGGKKGGLLGDSESEDEF